MLMMTMVLDYDENVINGFTMFGIYIYISFLFKFVVEGSSATVTHAVLYFIWIIYVRMIYVSVFRTSERLF